MHNAECTSTLDTSFSEFSVAVKRRFCGFGLKNAWLVIFRTCYEKEVAVIQGHSQDFSKGGHTVPKQGFSPDIILESPCISQEDIISNIETVSHCTSSFNNPLT